MRNAPTAPARARAEGRLASLKLVDELRTNEQLEFVYEGRTFRAFVTRDALIGCDELEHAGRRASARRGATTLVYSSPTNFALDCVDEYWLASGGRNETLTNPNGWDRLRRARDQATLNDIRDRLVREAKYRPLVRDADESSQIDDSDRANPSELASRILCSDRITVESLHGAGGYKPVAQTLEATVWQLLHIVDTYEQLIERLSVADPAALEASRRVLAERRRRERSLDASLDARPQTTDAPRKRRRPTLGSLDFAALLNSALDDAREK